MRERSKCEISSITFGSLEEMHFLQYWGIHQKEIDTPCQVYLCTLLKENCQPCCWIIWSRTKSKVVLCWLSIEHTIGNKCRLFQSPMFFQVVCLRKYIHRAHISIYVWQQTRSFWPDFSGLSKKCLLILEGAETFNFYMINNRKYQV